MRVLLQAVDGKGLGHLMRMAAVGVELQRLNPRVHQLLLTGSNYPAFLNQLEFPSLVMPASDAVPDGLPHLRRRTVSRACAENMVLSAALAYCPDVAVFDTYAPMSMLRRLKAAGTAIVIVLRRCRPRFMAALWQRGLAEIADAVLIPHDEDEFFHRMPRRLRAAFSKASATFVGPIVFPARVDRDAVASVRRLYGLDGGQKLLLILGGGGGYRFSTEAFLDAAVGGALRFVKGARREWRIVVVAGPFGPAAASVDYGPDVLVRGDEVQCQALMASAAVVVAPAGYNVVNEGVRVGARLVLCPAPRYTESQAERARWLASAGRAVVVGPHAGAARFSRAIAEAMALPAPKPRSSDGGQKAARTIATYLRDVGARPSEHRAAPASAADFRGHVVALGRAPVGRLVQRARRAMAAIPPPLTRSVTLTFVEADSGQTLPALAARLRGLRFQALVGIVPRTREWPGAGVFQSLTACRSLNLAFEVDMVWEGDECPYDRR